MTGLAGANPFKGAVALNMASVAGGPASMTVKATYIGTLHDNVCDGCIRGTDIGGTGGVMTLRAAKFMNGQNPIRSRPGIGKQRIRAKGATRAMARITGIAARKVGGPHQDIMCGCGAMQV